MLIGLTRFTSISDEKISIEFTEQFRRQINVGHCVRQNSTKINLSVLGTNAAEAYYRLLQLNDFLNCLGPILNNCIYNVNSKT